MKQGLIVKPILYGLVLLALTYGAIVYIPRGISFMNANGISIPVISSILFKTDPPLKSLAGRTNILLLGMGGGVHDGGDLTDSIQFLSYDIKNQNAVMVAIPRDIWIPSKNERINEAFRKGGLQLSKSEVSEVLGQTVHYAWIIDFSGFQQLIDLVGGVDLEIDRTFDDFEYPIAGKENDTCEGDPEYLCRYEHVHFEKGRQSLSGVKALQYVRSRHAIGEEGTDFARSKRQQKVFIAFKEKVTSPSFWMNTKNIQQLLAVLDTSFKTDMTLGEVAVFAKIFKNIPSGNLRHITLDTGDEEVTPKRPGLLINPPLSKYNGAWVLEPRYGTYDEIHSYMSCQLISVECDISMSSEG